MKTLLNLFKGKGLSEGPGSDLKNNLARDQYYCPMKCEGEKTYDSPGNCPECNMRLVPVKTGNTTGHNHGHDGHSHHGCC